MISTSAHTRTRTKELSNGSGMAQRSVQEKGACDVDTDKNEIVGVEEVALQRTANCLRENATAAGYGSHSGDELLAEAYNRCGTITQQYAKTFHLATRLLSREKREAVWAIYVWCRRTDELVDGPNSKHFSSSALDRWEERLYDIFNDKPYDLLDAALADTVKRFPVDLQPFVDMIGGMRMDLTKSRYASFEELYEYCYRVAGTVGLMVLPVMGIDEQYDGELEPIVRGALSLGTANQLTNVLRDVGEDVKEQERVYLPSHELAQYNIDEEELRRLALKDECADRVDERWKRFMHMQIVRAREYFQNAESSVQALDPSARWPVWCSLMLYREILNRIEQNGYDNFDKRAFVPAAQKLFTLPLAYLKATSTSQSSSIS